MNAVSAHARDTRGSELLDVERVRRDFPILARRMGDQPLCYLDNAASSQRPQAVIDSISRYCSTTHANVHRGVHRLSQQATELFEGARDKVRAFINARSAGDRVRARHHGGDQPRGTELRSTRFAAGDEI